MTNTTVIVTDTTLVTPTKHRGDERLPSRGDILRVAVRLPQFWAERPAVWLAQAVARFSLAGISDDRTKFYHKISQLVHRYAAEVEDIIISPPQKDPYTAVKTELLNQTVTHNSAASSPDHQARGDGRPYAVTVSEAS
jgi:hypothetical protein